MSSKYSISEEVLDQLVHELKGDDIVGIILAGSHARNEPTPYSDVDIVRFSTVLPSAEKERYTLRYIEGHLVSISTTTVEKKKDELSRPERAIWVVPGLRQAVILFDRTGAVAELKQMAIDFEWDPLQKDADEYVSYEVMGYAEEVHKVLGGLYRKDESAVAYGTLGLTLATPNMIAVQKGLFIRTENAFFDQVYETMGIDSSWTKYHRIAAGLDAVPENCSIFEYRGKASLYLYIETVQLLRSVLKSSDLLVAETAIARIQNSDLMQS
jgi:predicted nucleotidyltransferase